MSELPTAPVKRIMLREGISRISPGAVAIAANVAEDVLALLAEKALRSANRDKRRTVMEADMDAARRSLGLLE